ncbi:MAG TPA: DoxX family protein [Steroidobacteraceae bacterium]
MAITSIIAIAGRATLTSLFILAGVAKLVGPAPFLAHMDQFGVPRILLPAVIALEIGAGAGLLIGWRTPITAGVLSAFCAVTAIVFHRQLGDRVERSQFFKNMALAGALAALAATGVHA